MADREDARAAFELDWFGDPIKSARKVVDVAKAELRAEYQQARAQEQFWQQVAANHPDLAGRRALLMATFEEHPELGDLPADEGIEKLAALARQQLLGGRDADSSEREVMRGGPSHGSSFTEAPRSADSLGDYIRARAARRRFADDTPPHQAAVEGAEEATRQQRTRRERAR